MFLSKQERACLVNTAPDYQHQMLRLLATEGEDIVDDVFQQAVVSTPCALAFKERYGKQTENKGHVKAASDQCR